MNISLIAALDKNRLIGNKGKLPWKIPEDLQRFKKLTTGKCVVMGRSTFESIGKPLPERINIILTRDENFKLKFPTSEKRGQGSYCLLKSPICVVANSIDQVLKVAKEQEADEFMIIGGASIYEQFLPLANQMYLTWIDHEFKGDTYFPKFNEEDWEIQKEERLLESGYKIRFQILKRMK